MIYDPPDMTGCNCAQCVRSRRMQFILDGGSIEELKALVIELYDLVMNTEMDLNHAQAVIDGSWPDAERVIRTARARLKKKRALSSKRGHINKKPKPRRLKREAPNTSA